MALSIFWGVAALVTGCVALILISVSRRGAAAADGSGFDQMVYRDQLRDIERDKARGAISEEEAQRLHAEVARRLLDADRAARSASAAPGTEPPYAALAGVVALALGAAFWAYAELGTPGDPDQPMAQRIAASARLSAARPSQAELEASLPPDPALQQPDPEYAALMDKLRAAVAKRPDDLQGQRLLARNEARLGNFAAARQAQAKVVEILGADATDEDRLQLATLMIEAANGRISPEAEAALTAVISHNPDEPTALFFLGISQMQVERADLAFLLWRRLLTVAPADSPWRPEVRSKIEVLAELAGVRYEPPPAAGAALPGPDADAVRAAQDMTPEERQTMIRGMVDRLSQRLTTEGGSPDEWARLISALATLGDTDQAKAIWQQAQLKLAGDDAGLATVRDAAQSAGLTQ